jgi:hypothetical protein
VYSKHTIALISLVVQVLWAIGLIVSGLVLPLFEDQPLFSPYFGLSFFTSFSPLFHPFPYASGYSCLKMVG